MSMSTRNMDALIRSELWSAQLKETLKDDLGATGYVNWLTGFPDGNTFTIPSIGDATVRDYTEDTAVQYDAMDTGEFQFTITEYLSSGNYITDKARQDAYYAAQLESSFVPKQRRAIMEKVETDILALGAAGASGGQTANDANAINGASHRFASTGGSDGAREMALKDFAQALYALKKANVPDRNLIAVVDPSVEFTLNKLSTVNHVANNPMWTGVINTGIASGMRFVRNFYGFDVYTSNYLPSSSSEFSMSGSAGVCNLFFSADSSILPFVGAWRQLPKVDGEYNKDFQREEYVTTCRYGLKVYRPENLVVVCTDKNVVPGA